jgi:uncharacterized protein
MRIGVISDTHGTLPAEVHHVFEHVDRIIHAGDIGSQGVLLELETIAPVIAVAGNVDTGLGELLPALQNVKIEGVRVLVVHRPADVPRPLPEGVRVVVTGHTHGARIEEADGVMRLNPGSASRGRSGRGHSVALLTIEDSVVDAHVVPLP